MSPTSGGQYHWVSEFAPPKIQKFLSYMTGWLCAIGWQVYLAGVCFMVGSIIQGLIALNVEDYEWHSWHATLLTIAVITFAVGFNTLLAVRLPLLEGIALILHIAGFFAIIIPLWVMAPRASTHDALFKFTNNGGWSSTGLSAMVGLTAPLSVLIGYDCSVHMCRFYASLPVPGQPLLTFRDSRRDSRRWPGSAQGNYVVRRPQRVSRVHYGSHLMLHPR